jgi:hypothetical protein
MTGLKSVPFVLSQSKHSDLFFSNRRVAFGVCKVHSGS